MLTQGHEVAEKKLWCDESQGSCRVFLNIPAGFFMVSLMPEFYR